MIFAAPWVLVALAALPLLWWLLRVTPPAPRSEIFPGDPPAAGPERDRGNAGAHAVVAAGAADGRRGAGDPGAGPAGAGRRRDLAGNGPVLLVIDNGWASAGDWARRMQAANSVLDRAERAGRKAALLATAPDGSGRRAAVTAPMPVADLRARLAALQPEPWPPDRAAAAAALRGWHDSRDAAVGLSSPTG